MHPSTTLFLYYWDALGIVRADALPSQLVGCQTNKKKIKNINITKIEQNQKQKNHKITTQIKGIQTRGNMEMNLKLRSDGE